MKSSIEKPKLSKKKRFFRQNSNFLKKKTKLIKTDDGKQFANKVFNDWLELKKNGSKVAIGIKGA